jgi:hypothetical protein
VGAAARILTAGDVDGWAWGEGTADAGPEPPVLTFEKICTASPSTETTQPANSSEVERAATDARDTAWGVSLPNLFVVVLVVLGLAGAAAWLQRR